MRKLFHEVALQPDALKRSDANLLMRELRLDHARYVESIPMDWFQEAMRILDADSEQNRHKKLALLGLLRSSVLSTRSPRELGALRGDNWAEMIASANRFRSFDAVVLEKEIHTKSDSIDLEAYLEESEKELGAVSMRFRTPENWLDVIKPVIHSDNLLAIVDRYIDLSKPYYSKLFAAFLDWISHSRIAYLRIYVGPKEVSELRDSSWRKQFDSVVRDIQGLMRTCCPQSSLRILVSCCEGLHKRYLGTKTCGLELDYGFRLSGDHLYKLAVLREAALQDFKAEFLSPVGGNMFLASKVAWPASL